MATGTIQENKVLLWENPSPTDDFAGQTVSLDLSGYDMILLTVSTYWGGATGSVVLCHVGGDTEIFDFANSSSNLAIIFRKVTVNVNGVTFEDGSMRVQGSSTVNTRNNYCRPQKIYGIKA